MLAIDKKDLFFENMEGRRCVNTEILSMIVALFYSIALLNCYFSVQSLKLRCFCISQKIHKAKCKLTWRPGDLELLEELVTSRSMSSSVSTT